MNHSRAQRMTTFDVCRLQSILLLTAEDQGLTENSTMVSPTLPKDASLFTGSAPLLLVASQICGNGSVEAFSIVISFYP